MRATGEDLRGVGGRRSRRAGARGVAGHAIEFAAQNFAADGDALLGIAKRGEERGVKAEFALTLLFV